MKAKDAFYLVSLLRYSVGEQVVWKDVWLWDKPLSKVYPTLFRIVRRKYDTVANVLGSVPLNMSF